MIMKSDINLNNMNKTRQKVEALLEELALIYTPQYLQTVEFELGIDEAGRGPVFGSMIYSALWWPIELKQKLGALGFNDSKALTEQQREKLLQIIDLMKGKLVFYQTKELTAEYISISMNNIHQHTNLNEISHQAALELCRDALKGGFKVSHIYADTVGDPGKYTNFLQTNLVDYASVVKNITVQPKADRDHKVVGASSICAKVTRDKIIKQWVFREKLPFVGNLGSGYPGDPATKEWLQKNKDPIFGYPDLIRFSWNTTTNALQGSIKIKMQDKTQEDALKNFSIFEDRIQLSQDLWNMPIE